MIEEILRRWLRPTDRPTSDNLVIAYVERKAIAAYRAADPDGPAWQKLELSEREKWMRASSQAKP